MNTPYGMLIYLILALIVGMGTITFWVARKAPSESGACKSLLCGAAMMGILIVVELWYTTSNALVVLAPYHDKFEETVRSVSPNIIIKEDGPGRRLDYGGELDAIIDARDKYLDSVGWIGLLVSWSTTDKAASYEGVYVSRLRAGVILGLWVIDIIAVLVLGALHHWRLATRQVRWATHQ